MNKGEIISIIGHSGCGKSTIINAIAGMLHPASGTVTLHDRSVSGPGPDRGMVFQNYSLLPWLTVYQNIFQAVDAPLRNETKAEKHARVEHFLKMVNLWDHRHTYPGHISVA